MSTPPCKRITSVLAQMMSKALPPVDVGRALRQAQRAAYRYQKGLETCVLVASDMLAYGFHWTAFSLFGGFGVAAVELVRCRMSLSPSFRQGSCCNGQVKVWTPSAHVYGERTLSRPWPRIVEVLLHWQWCEPFHILS